MPVAVRKRRCASIRLPLRIKDATSSRMGLSRAAGLCQVKPHFSQ
jgi:hypothetical protein